MITKNVLPFYWVVMILLIASAGIGLISGIKKGSLKPVILGVLPMVALTLIANVMSQSNVKGQEAPIS